MGLSVGSSPPTHSLTSRRACAVRFGGPVSESSQQGVPCRPRSWSSLVSHLRLVSWRQPKLSCLGGQDSVPGSVSRRAQTRGLSGRSPECEPALFLSLSTL